MNDRNRIDDLFRDAMTGYRVEPSIGMWRRIERRFFPPSKFRPSGLITSILLLMVAGLMPWVLIPANVQQEKEPTIPSSGDIRQGYLIESATTDQLNTGSSNNVHLSGKNYSIKPTVYLASPDNPAGAPEEQFLASILDPNEDPSIQPILTAFQKTYIREQQNKADAAFHFNENDISRMSPYPTAFMKSPDIFDDIKYKPANTPNSSFSPKYESSYVRKAEISTGLNFNPSLVFYDPNPYNKMLGAEAIIQYKIASFSILSGLGFSRMEDVGSYEVNYVSNDSVGFYLRVVSFVPDPRNPGNVTYIVTQEPLYDSVPHTYIEDKTNYYSYIDIPLSFGYTFFQKSRISLTARVGVKFSVLVDKQEPTVDFWVSEAELIDIERQVPARMNTNWRFTAGVDFGYLITNKFSLHLEPAFEQYISPIYVETPGYNPGKPYVAGVKAGIRYNF
jgi:hypothetical protein